MADKTQNAIASIFPHISFESFQHRRIKSPKTSRRIISFHHLLSTQKARIDNFQLNPQPNREDEQKNYDDDDEYSAVIFYFFHNWYQ